MKNCFSGQGTAGSEGGGEVSPAESPARSFETGTRVTMNGIYVPSGQHGKYDLSS